MKDELIEQATEAQASFVHYASADPVSFVHVSTYGNCVHSRPEVDRAGLYRSTLLSAG